MTAGVLTRLDRTGHTEITWDTDDPRDVTRARREFDDLRGLRYLMTAKRPDGTRETIHEFDPEATTIIAQPQTVGG